MVYKILKGKIVLVCIFIFLLTSCKKKYNCTCTITRIVCANCYASNEPLATYYTSILNYVYKAKTKDAADANCKNDHAQATHTESNGSTVITEDCAIE